MSIHGLRDLWKQIPCCNTDKEPWRHQSSYSLWLWEPYRTVTEGGSRRGTHNLITLITAGVSIYIKAHLISVEDEPYPLSGSVPPFRIQVRSFLPTPYGELAVSSEYTSYEYTAHWTDGSPRPRTMVNVILLIPVFVPSERCSGKESSFLPMGLNTHAASHCKYTWPPHVTLHMAQSAASPPNSSTYVGARGASARRQVGRWAPVLGSYKFFPLGSTYGMIDILESFAGTNKHLNLPPISRPQDATCPNSEFGLEGAPPTT
ncbi:uncharacterized protein LACBIDRAFT_330660 [Laccaria bicolor S238N-H82]|uniref:Predicted protein n=1 Tax=Laccaria bicolor (strain S238N-H82 / ATCC MYA-4686) TaxID=486041 RepID=B0DM21_LACBS|nr:uncharacterized protein LACBIDRAFT_330660 [Laccaria bicolor S238N-H82]EDR04491.1 predicted protein [Laccaria bicolor S238N-H82]|eukprot:XP_001885010.1 predicted protein [Laccaria bicolor S238N-H82]